MSATLFLAICILGCDFLLYFLFKWTYGEKRRSRERHSRPRRAFHKAQPLEFVAARRKSLAIMKNPQNATARLQEIERRRQDLRVEREAYQRIAATFAEARR